MNSGSQPLDSTSGEFWGYHNETQCHTPSPVRRRQLQGAGVGEKFWIWYSGFPCSQELSVALHIWKKIFTLQDQDKTTVYHVLHRLTHTTSDVDGPVLVAREWSLLGFRIGTTNGTSCLEESEFSNHIRLHMVSRNSSPVGRRWVSIWLWILSGPVDMLRQRSNAAKSSSILNEAL
jgi:hypothetical protein